jgi:PPM family protein phosphatase
MADPVPARAGPFVGWQGISHTSTKTCAIHALAKRLAGVPVNDVGADDSDGAFKAMGTLISAFERAQRVDMNAPSEHDWVVPLRIEVAGETNVGMKRNHNEDNFSIIEEAGLYVVADGMGGHASGEVASGMAVEALKEFFASTAEDPERTWPYKMDRSKGYEENRLITGIKLANLRIFESAQRDSKQRGMGTTIVTLFAVEDGVYVGHVGDSRVYRVRDKKIELLTEDHSLLNDYIKMKRLTPEEIANFPHKNVIVRALGMKDVVKVDTRFETPRENDIYLLCSDGLSGPVTDEQILEICSQGDPLKQMASQLIVKANENGGPDNVTVVLLRWVN